MSAKIAVLGLVIEEPGPAHRLTAKLRQRLSSAGFVDSNVYSALTRLERDGLVRAIGEGQAPERTYGVSQAGTQFSSARRVAGPPLAAVGARGAAASAAEQRGVRYQQAGAGLPRSASRRTPGSRPDSRSFEATPAGVRHFEEWLLRSSTAPPLRDELHMKVALCQPHNLPRLVELVYGQELICLGRVQELKHTFERMCPPAPTRWSGLVLVHIRDAELSFWEARLSWLQGVRESLEGMHAEYERATRTIGLPAQRRAAAAPSSALAGMLADRR
jgi:DNA-binding PadR family transcriptional regulator